MMLNKTKNNVEEFNVLIMNYYGSLVNYAKSITKSEESAEDIVQDLFVCIWEKQIRLEPENTIRNYLYVSTYNRALNYIRTEKRLQERHNKIEVDNDDFRDVLIQEEVYRRLREAINTLPERSAQIINLTIQGLSQQEIAEKMDISVSSVKTMKAYAITKLKKILPSSLFTYLLINLIYKN